MIIKTPNLRHVKYILAYINQYSPIKNTKGSIGQRYPYSTRKEINIVYIIYIYRARAIFLIFCVHQDTESEQCEIYIKISQPIFTGTKIPRALWDNDIHTLKYGRRILWWFFIFMDLEPFFYYFVITKTPNMRHVKYILAYINQYLPIKNTKGSIWQRYPYSTRKEINIV